MKWVKCHTLVACKLNELKTVARKFYYDKSDREILTELVRYSLEDIKDALSYGTETRESPNPPNHTTSPSPTPSSSVTGAFGTLGESPEAGS